MWDSYYSVSSVEDALSILESEGHKARVIAGGTDLVLEMKRDMHPEVRTLIDINRVSELNTIYEEDEFIYIRPTVTHNQCLVSRELAKFGIPLLKACKSIGAPQIRNIGTVYGNLITASPANDTISALIVLDAEILIRSSKKEKWVKLIDFYLGVRKTVLHDDEMVINLRFKKMSPSQKGTFTKYLLRQAHGISVANVSILLDFEGEKIKDAVISLGAVAPTVRRAKLTEDFLIGKKLNEDVISEAGQMVSKESLPIDDIRASKELRNHLLAVLLENGLNEINNGKWSEYEAFPVLLWGKNRKPNFSLDTSIQHTEKDEIRTRINGKENKFSGCHNQTLLSLVRDQAGLTGTKLGCGEGECGACTLYLNGLPVLSCLVPAPMAHMSEITTIEGLVKENELHPVQKAFVEEGAVQCGYCTPGFIMSAAKLIEEKTKPTQEEIREGLAGNICRCTGYYSIISAVEKASKMNSSVD